MTIVGIDHLHFYVKDVRAWSRWFQEVWAFHLRGERQTADTLSHWLQHRSIHLVLSQALNNKGVVATYLEDHPQGLVDVALQVAAAVKIYSYLWQHNQTVTWLYASETLQHLQLRLPFAQSEQAPLGFHHSLIERHGEKTPILPGFTLAENMDPLVESTALPSFTHIDHVVLNVPSSQLHPVSTWYQKILHWEPRFRYQVSTARSGLNSTVLCPASSALQLAINEPVGSNSQIEEFIQANGGPGIQHVALHTAQIGGTVAHLRQRGVAFLTVPSTYYASLAHLPKGFTSTDLASLQLLVDQPDPLFPDQELLQTFTQPLFPEPTFFFEVIQRNHNARGFGERNFQALFEAVERQQQERTSQI
ncbi:MAG: 4-hydroxyphenylpyruvate dioxygenase [Synechococcaceae cyanobacterium SM2_3_1]|nr:4-hydroxyphenylpyruvate dioxygenase [Synechococcaceae cyanobacterium SM2_3_1]